MSTGSSEESSGSSGLQDEVMSPSSEAVFAWPNYSVSPCPSQDTTEEHRSVSQIGTCMYTVLYTLSVSNLLLSLE